MLSGDFSRAFRVAVEYPDQSHCHVLAAEDSDVSVAEYIRFLTGRSIQLVRTGEDALKGLIDIAQTATAPGTRGEAEAHVEDAADSAVVSRIDSLLKAALRSRASDVHFEPSEQQLVCRARIDGFLQVRSRIPREMTPAVLSRIKILAGLDIAEKRRPQDGRIRFPFDGRTVDIRVSVIPTDFGEKAVLRLLDKASLKLDLASLGFDEQQLALFRQKISLPHGIILVTGPTGSGKTTTLYAALNHLRSPDVNISTVEDPIEYNLEGINQTQVKPEIGVTFSSMLRALLRQDPNIIMVGEIRDPETLEIAIRASLTGHLVLSTLHTNDAVSTLARLVDMGAEPLLLASTLRLVVAQRLVRRNCQSCFEAGLSEANLVAAHKLGLEPSGKAGGGPGCEGCSSTGFVGRTALFELLPIEGSIKQAIANGESEERLRQRAEALGFKTMLSQGRDLINAGVTTPLEVLREIST